ncbi:hypothetical protein BDY21DRAFT_343616 [Lineolata rhizophorae]|uniref:Uncharacterized protein n=1 Tax=Lineolata rhizophorae TaxID=578093 RepID=A0A6A6P0K6_9PEZI|nr:hypothetical protein BDY21DRAFT_343616 [Lineolata rhizophorae]
MYLNVKPWRRKLPDSLIVQQSEPHLGDLFPQKMSKTTVLITGANQGLGFETAKILLSSSDFHIILGCRDASKGDAAVKSLESLPSTKGTVSTVPLDVVDDALVDSTSSQVSEAYGYIDVLVNNAGVYSQHQHLRAALRDSFAVNVVGAASVTDAFLPLLQKSQRQPRIVFVTSAMGSLAHSSDPTSHHFGPYADAYRASKAALNMLLVQYTNNPRSKGVKVLGADPGFCATKLTGDPEGLKKLGAAEPSVGAEAIANAVKGKMDGNVGKVSDGEGKICPW